MEELTYIIISLGWDGLPIAYKLKQEGCEVMVGQVQSKTELGEEEDETPEQAEYRLKQYDGMLDKMPARKLVDALKDVKDKEKYFIFCDQNNLYPYAQELLDAGFTKGLFPLEEDFEFEKDREKAMQFVSEAYPQVQIIPFEEFENVDMAVNFLKKSNKVYVIQSKGDHVGTMVPLTDDIDAEREQMITQLTSHREDYEKDGIILKEKLIRPIEITPQMVFYNGQMVFSDLDIETKNIGDGENNGNQVGCGSNLVVRTQFEDKINEIAFPKAVQEMAMVRTGIFVFDISLYLTKDGIFFGEFCPNRFGYDSLMTEITMAGGAKDFFTKIITGENPLKKNFGAAVRLFNLNRQEDKDVIVEDDENVYLYEVYMKDKKILSTGYCWDLGVATGAGDNVYEAVDQVYSTVKGISFKELYTKSKNDFLDVYPTSILFRLHNTQGDLYGVDAGVEPDYKMNYETKIRDMESSHNSQMVGFRTRLSSILDEEAN